MRRFSSSCSSCAETLLLVLLCTIGIVGNDVILVHAQNTLGDNNAAAIAYDEHVLYSNPQFYSLPTENGAGDAPPPEATATMGLLFNIRSKLTEEDDAIIYITGFEFYTSSSSSVLYELKSREGKYYDNEMGMDGGPGIGELTSFDPISGPFADGTGECTQVLQFYGSNINNEGQQQQQGNIALSERAGNTIPEQICPLTIIPKEDFGVVPSSNPWILEANSTRSFYITLTSDDLLVSPSTTSSSFDAVVVASTPDLELYEGVAARTYPFHEEEGNFYYDRPMGFIGKIYYRVEGGDVVIGVPTKGPITNPPTTSPPTATLTETDSTETDSTNIGGGENSNNSEEPSPQTTSIPTPAPVTPPPTAKPTKRCRPGRPCLTPSAHTTTAPTGAPLISSPFPTSVELMVYLENVPNRIMSPREEKEYVEVVTEFLKGNENLRKNGVNTNKLDIFYHNILDEDEKRGTRSRSDFCRRFLRASSKKFTRQNDKKYNQLSLCDFDDAEDGESFVYNYNTKSRYVPKVYPTMYVMTTVEVITKLPDHVAAFFVWDELREHEMTLIDKFNRNSLFVSYFKYLTNITTEVVDELSRPPTLAPTEFTAAGMEGLEDGEEMGNHRYQVLASVGIALGFLWFFLTLCSMREIVKHRRNWREDEKVRKTKQATLHRMSTQRRLMSKPKRRLRAFKLEKDKAMHTMHLDSLGTDFSGSRTKEPNNGSEVGSGSDNLRRDDSTSDETGRLTRV
mmetsp:Transcript_18776/g.33790  ORF Transcript_18776/g.33790 Transcript_18776/m.33790 type:complete len:738 (-) Transcript_18776:139-2352(-)